MSAPNNNWPVLTADEITRRLAIGRKRRAGQASRIAALRARRRRLIDAVRSRSTDDPSLAIKTLEASPDAEL
jgi:hypothetical protein